MAIILTKKELDNVSLYRYETNPATPMDGVFEPWWNWCVSMLPVWVSPNLVTLMGIVPPITIFMYLVTFDVSMTAVLPAHLLCLHGFAIFWYQTMDAIDGKQARKTNNCSPLG